MEKNLRRKNMKRILSMVLVTMMIVISTSTMVAFAEVGTPTWSGTTLTWGADETATSYSVALYNTGYLVKTVTVTDATSYDFASDMTAYGSYFATVTPTGGTASAYSTNNVVGTNLAMGALQKLDDYNKVGNTLAANIIDGDITTSAYMGIGGNDVEKGIRFELCDTYHMATVKSYAVAAHFNVGMISTDAYYSTDGDTWIKAESTSAYKNASSVADTVIYTLSAPVSCRWFKLVGTASGAKTTIMEIAVFGDVASYVPLDSLKIDGNEISGFAADKTGYSVDLIEGTGIPTISATTAVEGATVNVTQATSENPVATITVTKDEAVMTYTVNFNIIPTWKHYNLAQGKVDSTNSGKNFYSGGDASKSLDGDLATMANPKSGGSSIVVDMGASVKISSVGIIEFINSNILTAVKMYYSDTANDDSWEEITLVGAATPEVGKYNHGGTLKPLRLHICEVGEVEARYFKLETTAAVNELVLFPAMNFSYSTRLGALTAGTKPTAVFTATNDKIYDITPECECIFAIYKDGALFDVVTQNVSKNTVTALTSEEIASITATKDVPAEGVITAKGFIWADFDTMVPLAQLQ